MNRAENEFIFPRIRTIMNVEWDEKGFRVRYSTEDVIRWSDVVQIAVVYEIHPIAIIDWDYVAFRLKAAELSVWVEIKKDDPFIAEIERRFAPITTPRMADWKDEDRCMRSYSIWPKERVGEPLYINRRISRWSWKKSLALKKWANQALEPTTTSVTPPAGQEARQP